jgi:hypothetical protein
MTLRSGRFKLDHPVSVDIRDCLSVQLRPVNVCRRTLTYPGGMRLELRLKIQSEWPFNTGCDTLVLPRVSVVADERVRNRERSCWHRRAHHGLGQVRPCCVAGLVVALVIIEMPASVCSATVGHGFEPRSERHRCRVLVLGNQPERLIHVLLCAVEIACLGECFGEMCEGHGLHPLVSCLFK